MDKPDEPRVLLGTTTIAVRWGDMDANEHVNNATYFTYMEQARIEWLRSLDMQNTAEGQGPVVAQTSCNYTAPIPYPETLEVKTYGGSPGRASFRTYYEIHGTVHAGVKYADGHAVMVWVDRGTGKSCPMPEALRALLKNGD